MKTCTIKREGKHWSVVFTCEGEQELVSHASWEAVGIDVGLLHFGTLSDGSTIENPRHLRRSEHKLRKLQAALSRKKRGSKRRRKAAQVVGKHHRHIRNQRAGEFGLVISASPAADSSSNSGEDGCSCSRVTRSMTRMKTCRAVHHRQRVCRR